MMHKSSLPPVRVQDGKPVSGPMPRGAGAARTAGAVKERGKGEDAGGEAPGHGLSGAAMAAELIFLEGGGPSATLVLGSPQMSAHLRVAQTSGTAVGGPGTAQDANFYFLNPMWKIRKYQVQGTQKFW